MNKAILAILVAMSCLAGSCSTTTTEQPSPPPKEAVVTEAALLEVEEEVEGEEASTTVPDLQEDDEDTSAKSKRTIEQHLGYASLGSRILAEPYQQYEQSYGRALYSQYPQGRNGGQAHYKVDPQQEAQQQQLLRQYYQQLQQQQQLYQTAGSQQQQYVASAATPSAATTTSSNTASAAYQQPTAAAVAPTGNAAYVIPQHQQQQVSLFGAAQSPFAQTSFLGNPFLGLGGGNPYFFQNPLAMANPLASLFPQQPNHFGGAGPQLIPVIILRVGGGPVDNHAVMNPVQALLYQYLQQQQQQQHYQAPLAAAAPLYNTDAQPQHPGTSVKTIYVHQQQPQGAAVSSSADKYSAVAAYSAKKLAAAGLDGSLKARKPEQGASSYNSQYKYAGYKDATSQ